MEGSHSGLVRGSGEAVGQKWPRGFESHPLRTSASSVQAILRQVGSEQDRAAQCKPYYKALSRQPCGTYICFFAIRKLFM
jgi:hypothetical protein